VHSSQIFNRKCDALRNNRSVSAKLELDHIHNVSRPVASSEGVAQLADAAIGNKPVPVAPSIVKSVGSNPTAHIVY
jgi:hypothetical protein